MLASVEVMSPDGFDAWLASGNEDLGQETWEGVCAKCHGLAGEGGVARRIAGSPILSNPQSLETIVRNGRATRTGVMPAVGAGWSDEQIEALATYLTENPPSGVTG
jgi:mono/diheme cytochrome c family protein